MDLDAVEAGLFGPHRGGHEILDQLLDLGGGKRARAGRRVVGGRDGRLADQRRRAAHARMVQLDDGQAADSS